MTTDEVLALPVMVDLPTAGRAFGIGRNGSYELARRGRFPVPVHDIGCRKRVTRASVLRALDIEETEPESTPASAA